ncbi:MAG TPA: FHA domain-containing protein [Gammaproteobacteria bacterium]|nr:FHA domain-containing protein [Gammaproteobacteria bacterium]
MASLILEIGSRGLHHYQPLDNRVTTIGRALDNDVILSDPTVAPHHAQIIRHDDDRLEIVNLAEVNQTRVDRRRVDRLVTSTLPLALEIGRVQLQLLSRDQQVAATRPLAGNGRRSHLFGNAWWAVLLVLACLLVGGLDFYQSAYNSFKWSDLIKYVLRETVVTLGIFVLAMSILERLLVNRWEIRQLVTAIALTYLIYCATLQLAGLLDYLFSATWPGTLLYFGWYLVAMPAAIALYLIHISHFRQGRGILLAILIASPVAVPGLLQSPRLHTLFDDFSSAARYHNSLSSLNLHLDRRISIDEFLAAARDLEPGEFAD